MKLVNRTAYRDDDLRAFLLAGLRAMDSSGRHKTVRVVYTRPGERRRAHAEETENFEGVTYVSGEAQYGLNRRREGREATMRLPKPPLALDLRAFARVWEHEIGHLQGLRHGDMSTAMRTCSGELPAWAEGLAVRLAEPPAPPSREERLAQLVAEREHHAREMLAKWEARAKRAKAAVKRWAERVRGFERRRARRAAGSSA